MAHFVAKTLHMRPNEILDTWCVPELIVAYGQYVNDITRENYQTWASQDPQYRKGERPEKYGVKFYGNIDG